MLEISEVSLEKKRLCMVRSLLLFFSYIACTSGLYAQDITYKPGVRTSILSFHFTILDTSNNHVFRSHPEVKLVSVPFSPDNYPQFIYILDSNNDRLLYDMGFKGDELALKNKYEPINFLVPKVSLDRLYGRNKFDFPTHWRIGTTIYADSVVYTITYNTGGEPNILPMGSAARFEGHYENLAVKIADELRLNGTATLPDSVIVIEGVIEKGIKQPIKDLKLLVGRESVFSDIAMRVIGNERNKWLAATHISGVLGASRFKFYIELHPDGSVTILTPKHMDAKFG